MNDQYGLEEVHKDYLRMLDDIHKYCREHGIRYSLSGGTLLGAVRHKGFIPWDDDADLMFDRRNYRLLMRFLKAHPLPQYEMIGSGWVKRITRVDNPLKSAEKHCVDLFVFDPVPPNPLIAKTKVFVIRLLQGMMKDNPEYERFSFVNRCLLFVTWLLGRPFSRERKLKWYESVSQWGRKNRRVNIYNTWFDQVGRLQFDRKILDRYVSLEFEGRQYMAIGGWDSYLTELYGDYMRLPPKEKRVPSH